MTDLKASAFTDPATGMILPYRIYVPDGCTAAKPCGLLLFLHGAGERGSDNQAQLANDALAWIDPVSQRAFPTIVLYPQCPSDMQWVDTPWTRGHYALTETAASRPMSAALALVDWAKRELPVDPERVLVTGLSMGGYGAWDFLLRRAMSVAGAVILCGGGDPSRAGDIRDIPVWAFHGDVDPAVPVKGSRLMVQALRAAGGAPRYTELAGWGHDVWVKAYRDPEVRRWLLSQRRPVASGTQRD